MSHFGYYFDRYLSARSMTCETIADYAYRGAQMRDSLIGMQNAIGSEIELRITQRLRDERLVPSPVDEE